MIRLPPRSTLFPTRRSSDLIVAQERERLGTGGRIAPGEIRIRVRRKGHVRGRIRLAEGELRRNGRSVDEGGRRSEEHTSELQSRLHLVCRLLLEKKKKKKKK